MRKYGLILILCFLSGCASAPAATPTSEATPTVEAQSNVTLTPVLGDTTPIVPIATSTVPFDALFIDTMTALAQNTDVLLQSALTSGEHEEITAYAQTSIDAQGTRTQQMSEWRASWYPDVETATTLLTNATEIQIDSDAEVPFDMRFINALIDQYRVTIGVAQLAQTQATHPELRTLAEEIITAYNADITQLESWRQTWFNVSG
jgi:uncharacterized protein (DUF305 family)